MPIRSKLRTVLAQKDQLLEICPVVRLGKPIICEGLSVPCDKPQPSAHAPVLQSLATLPGIMLGPWSPNKSSLYDVKQNRREAQEPAANLILANEPDNPVTGMVEPDGIEPTTPCLQSRCSPS
jgi:hypothetical protein